MPRPGSGCEGLVFFFPLLCGFIAVLMPDRIRDAFRAGPISRFRATLAVIFAGAAVLAAGGMLEYASGSPAAGMPGICYSWRAPLSFSPKNT